MVGRPSAKETNIGDAQMIAVVVAFFSVGGWATGSRARASE